MRLLTVEEAAEYLKIHPHVLRRWLREGKLPGIKLGNHWRIDESDLKAFLESQKKKSSNPACGNGKLPKPLVYMK